MAKRCLKDSAFQNQKKIEEQEEQEKSTEVLRQSIK
jgi:hypothetical protein